MISHTMPDGSEKPVAYGSMTLSKTEQNYPQIEKKALAIIFGVKKFHQYIYGRKITLFTDHKPLTKTGLPALAAARLQRWAITLSAYQYDLIFRPTGKHGNADCLSRLPSDDDFFCGSTTTDASLFNVQQLGVLPIKPDQLKQETAQDLVLSKVLRHMLEGWPGHVEPELQPYFIRRQELWKRDV